MMALVHDLAEAQGKQNVFQFIMLRRLIYGRMIVGDIAPRENIPKSEKRRLEAVCFSFLQRFLTAKII